MDCDRFILMHLSEEFYCFLYFVNCPPKYWVEEVRQMNIHAINRWIVIAKRIVRLSKRKQRDKKQNKLTKYFTLITIKISKPIQSIVDQSERKLLQPSITTLTTTKTASLSRWDIIVTLRLSPTTTNTCPTVRKPKEWKCILKSVNKFCSNLSNQ